MLPDWSHLNFIKTAGLRPPICFYGIEGLKDRRNDALFRPALPRVNSDSEFVQKTLVFFGGDIQNFMYLMEHNDPKILYERWCLETTAMRLKASFPSHHIVVIKPSRVVFDHISCFDNFVDSNYLGMPKHIYCYRGLLHLESVLIKMSKKIRATPSEQLFEMLLNVQNNEDGYSEDNPSEGIMWRYELMSAKKKNMLLRWQKKLRLNKYPITLVAFSKGCVVLNQFLYEFHYCKRLEPHNQDSSIVDRIEAMYWLDAGHPGRSSVYPTSRGMLKTLTDLGIEVFVHVSQYQTEDILRPWIRRQWLEFVEILKSLNAKLVIRRHLSETTELPSHFNVLDSFKDEESLFETVTLSAPPLSPSPPPPHSANYPRPEQTPSQRNFMRLHVLGISIVTPSWNPYLGLQLILRRPYNEIMPDPSALHNLYYDIQNSSDSESQDSSDAEVSSPDTQSRSNSAQSWHYSASPESSLAQSPASAQDSTTIQNLNAQPSTSGTQNLFYSTAQPSTSGTQNQHSVLTSTSPSAVHSSDSAQDSTPVTQNLYFTAQPSTSGTQDLLYSSAQPSTSGTQNDSNFAQPSASGTQRRSNFARSSSSDAELRPSANTFKVLFSVQSARIDFDEDHEAADAYRTAKYFKIDSPVIATATEWPAKPGYNIYTPLKDFYTPLVLNPARAPSRSSMAGDSAAAATLRSTEDLARPIGIVPRTPAGNPNVAPNYASFQPSSSSQAARAFQSNAFQNEAVPSTSQDRRVVSQFRPIQPPSSSSDESNTSRGIRMDVDSTDSSGSDTPQVESAPVARRILRSRRSNVTTRKRFNMRNFR